MIGIGTRVYLTGSAVNLEPRKQEPDRFEAGELGLVVGVVGQTAVVVSFANERTGVVLRELVAEAKR